MWRHQHQKFRGQRETKIFYGEQNSQKNISFYHFVQQYGFLVSLMLLLEELGGGGGSKNCLKIKTFESCLEFQKELFSDLTARVHMVYTRLHLIIQNVSDFSMFQISHLGYHFGCLKSFSNLL